LAPEEIVMTRRLAAESLGTFWLVFGGCGSAILAAAFPEFAPLIGDCRFANCRHQSEPDCAVRAAFARGDVDPRRMRIYDTLLEEGEYSARRALHGGNG
jgi:putative ribosome biogenesis GTPase RsgA